MASRRWRDDWQRRAEKVHQLCQDRTVPLWQKAHLVGRAFADVELDALQSKHRKKLYSKLAGVNAILAKYPIETFDDYVLIDTADLHRILAAFKDIANIRV